MTALLIVPVVLGTGFHSVMPVHFLSSAWGGENARDLYNEIRLMSKNPSRACEQEVAVWMKRAAPVLPKFNEIGLALSLHSLSQLKKGHCLIKSIPESFIQSWENSALNKMNGFNSQGLANSIYAFSLLGIHPSDQFLGAWQRAAFHSMDDFNSQELSISLYAFSLLGIQPREQYVEAWQKSAFRSLGDFNPQELSISLYAFSLLGIQPREQFIEAWQKSAFRSMGNFSPQNLANSLYAFSLLGIHPRREFLKAWEKRAVERLDDFVVEELHQIFSAEKGLFARFKIPLPPKISSRVKAGVLSLKEQDTRQSNSQKRIAHDIKLLFPQDLREEYWSDAIASYVDFAVPSSHLVIQFDGPHHYLVKKGVDVLRPQDQMLDFILRNEGWTVVRIHYAYWSSIANQPQSDRLAALRKTLGLTVK